MQLPYQRLKVCGDVVFLAQGSNIHAFKLDDRSPVASWSHPDLKKGIPAASSSSGLAESPSVCPGPTATDGGDDGTDRPSKRVKLDADSADGDENSGAVVAPGIEDGTAGQGAGGKKKKGSTVVSSKPTDHPLVTILEATTDGRHLVAVTGNDKTIWCFEHDGAGHFKELSRRAMPKRPSSVAITPDGKTIISGDKFGDVYSLPLIPSAYCPEPAPLPSSAAATGAGAGAGLVVPTRASFKPQADETTVHSARNLRALAAQKMHLQQQQQKKAHPTAVADDEGVTGGGTAAFEHALLLGHVSMLTSVALASDAAKGRDYILTADRDEHIRVSRGIPHTHVTENFCLGHEQFVSELCVVPAGAVSSGSISMLVSGGGDPDLYAWDWLQGKLLATSNLLGLVQRVCPTAERLAVSRLRFVTVSPEQAVNGSRCLVVVICERVPAVFIFTLGADGELRHHNTVALPAFPLDIGPIGAAESSSSPTIIVSVDPSSATAMPEESSQLGTLLGLVRLDADSAWEPFQLPLAASAGELPDRSTRLSQEEIQKSLYTVESLRKTAAEGGRGASNEATIETEEMNE